MAENNRRRGALRDRLHFQARGSIDDGWGNSVPGAGAFATEFTMDAAMRPRIGGEEVTAARLDGRQPYVVTVRNTTETRGITTAWRAVDARDSNRIFNIVSPPADPDGRNQWIEFLVEQGSPS